MDRTTRIYVGTRKGLFRFCSNDGRRSWMMEPPALGGWSVYHAVEDPRDRSRVYAAARSEHWGPMVARSIDGGASWDERGPSPAFAAEDGLSVNAVWYVQPGHRDRPGEVWAGADPGALFRSRDWGESWEPVDSLTRHATRGYWMAGGGGLCLHKVVLHPANPDSLIATISAGGAFRTDDGGVSWRPINRGVRADFLPDSTKETGVGHCVHSLVRSPVEPDWLFQQNHCGMYRSEDGGASWQECRDGLPSEFGFPAAVHPRQPRTVYIAPLLGDSFRAFPDGAMAVWRSRDGGDSWEELRRGLPQHGAYTSVFRAALTTDAQDPVGIYLGTATGQMFFSPDEGDSWEMIAGFLPPILSVEVA
jgi:photosystem II stability/assembly factor-like uncharacterized protein